MSRTSLNDFIEELRNRENRVRISEKSAKHLLLVGVRSLRLIVAHSTRLARRHFRNNPKKNRFRMYEDKREVRVHLWFHRKRNLKKIRARFAPAS